MHKPHSLLTAALAVGIGLLLACSNNASTEPAPATQTPIPRATQTLPSAPPPRLNPSNSGPGVLENPERFGVYNTNSRWLFKSGGQIRSRPMISDGTVYVGSDGGLGAPGLYAISIETGEELWVFPTENGVQSSPALADGVVYFWSHDGNLYAVDTESGLERWHYDTGTDARLIAIGARGSGVDASVWASSPVVHDGVIYFGSLDGYLYAIH